MGYREKLVQIPKKCKQQYENLSYNDLRKKINIDDEFETFTNLPEDRELLILSYRVEKNKPYLKKFFDCFNPQESCETRYEIITKEGLKDLIENHADKVQEMIKDEIKDLKRTDRTEEDKVLLKISQLHLKRDAWGCKIGNIMFRPYKLVDEETSLQDMTDGQIVADESVEYQIFNMVFIYNTFDWDNNYLIVSGW